MALILFVGLLIVGIYLDELERRHAGLLLLSLVPVLIIFVGLGLPSSLFTVLLAIADVVLVIRIFRGDLRIR